MADRLRKLADNLNASFESATAFNGTAWLSERPGKTPGEASSFVPAGLHLGFGIAKMHSHSNGHGEFAVDGPALTSLWVPEGGATFQTKLETQRALSFGLHLPFCCPENEDIGLADILETTRKRKLLAISGNMARRSASLVSRIDPLFQGDARELVLKSRAIALVACLHAALDTGAPVNSSAVQIKVAENARDYIETYLRHPLTLEQIASAVGVCISSLTIHFRSVYNESISLYLTRRRMEQGMKAISEGANVAQAAYMVGYKPNAFSTAFKRYYGFSPSVLMRKNEEGDHSFTETF